RGARLPDGRASGGPRGQGPGDPRVGDDDRARARGRARDGHASRLARHPHRLSRALRRNVLALGADYGLFMVGLSFVSQATILPAFAAYLGAPNVVLGAIPAVMTLGWFLPSLFAAGHTEALGQKLPFVLRLTVWERAPFLVLALAAFVAAERTPALVLGVLLTMLLVVTGVGGVLMPAWMDIVGRAIPVTLRGRFFALSNLAAAGAGFSTVYALRAWEAPAAEAGVFTMLLFAGQIAGNVTLGWLADRLGHRLVIVAGVAAMVGANALALGAPSLGAFGAVFVLTGVQG